MLLFLAIWAIAGSNPDLGRPWSGWFTAMFVIVVLKFLIDFAAASQRRS